MTANVHTAYSAGLKRIRGWFSTGKHFASAHKFASIGILIVIVGVAWWGYERVMATGSETRYVLGTAAKGTVISTVSASGQVSASRQVAVKGEVSGHITAIVVKAGDMVTQGQVIARIDATDAQKAVRDAQNNLETAQLSLEKLQQPVTGLTLLQAQNAVTSAEDSLSKTYDDSNNDIVNVFLDLPDIMTSLQDIVIGTGATRGSQWNVDYYKNETVNYDTKAISYRDDTYNAYVAAKTAYDKTFADYKAMGNSPNTSQIESVTNETYDMLKAVSAAVKNADSFIQFYEDQLTTHNLTPVALADTALADLSSYINSTNSQLSTLLSNVNAIKTGKQSIIEKNASLADLTAGPDALDVRSSNLTIEQRQDALADAQQELAKYTVRAPFAGMITSIGAYVGDDASGATIANLITSQQVIQLSLNEVDAAKVSLSDKATLTFDAIDDLSLTGSVIEMDPVGTVSQGVVSYTIKIGFDSADARVKPGMTVSASIITDAHQDVLVVPSSAVKTQGGASYVQVFDPAIAEGGAAGVTSATAPRQVPVETGLSDDTNVEILSGLTEGEQIVTRTVSTIGTSAASGASTAGGRTVQTTTLRGAGGFAAPAGGVRF